MFLDLRLVSKLFSISCPFVFLREARLRAMAMGMAAKTALAAVTVLGLVGSPGEILARAEYTEQSHKGEAQISSRCLTRLHNLDTSPVWRSGLSVGWCAGHCAILRRGLCQASRFPFPGLWDPNDAALRADRTERETK